MRHSGLWPNYSFVVPATAAKRRCYLTCTMCIQKFWKILSLVRLELRNLLIFSFCRRARLITFFAIPSIIAINYLRLANCFSVPLSHWSDAVSDQHVSWGLNGACNGPINVGRGMPPLIIWIKLYRYICWAKLAY